MASALVLGSTGMVGSHILSTLRSASASPFTSVEVIARRAPPAVPDAAVQTRDYVEKDTAKWAAHVSLLSPPPAVLFCALATTRAAAGGFDKQYKIEHDLNIELAKAAREAGTKTYVLISSAGANPTAMLAYPKMKGEIEEHVKELGFEHTIIIRPGLIAGDRQEHRMGELVFRKIAAGLGKISTNYLKDGWAQDADVIARAAVAAAKKAENGAVKDKVWLIAGSDIIRLEGLNGSSQIESL